MYHEPIVSRPIRELAEQLKKNNPGLESFHCRLFSVDDAQHLYNAMLKNTYATYALIEIYQSAYFIEIEPIRAKILKIIETNAWVDRCKWQTFGFFEAAKETPIVKTEPIVLRMNQKGE